MMRKILTITLFFGLIGGIQATHNRAGEFKIQQIGELTIRATIITYTKTSSIQADRDTLTIFWGDGTFSNVKRSNGQGQKLDNDIKRNEYTEVHTYPGRATYTLSMRDKNRVGNIVNIPNSIGLPFYIEATYTFLNPQFQGSNNSACLLQPPVDFACVGQPFIHNPNAYDPDNDSLAYELVIPHADSGLLVPLYSFPDQIGPGADNNISLDPVTGDFVWDSPKILGEYNIAIRIKEYRKGFLINSFIRDMQILVLNCDGNRPPEIDVVEEVCVVAGELLKLEIAVSDPDIDQRVKLTALGGPFILNSPAQLLTANNFMNQPFSSTLEWRTTCEHISNEYYSIILKAVDNLFDTTGLATLKTVRIKVVGPAPINVASTSDQVAIKVTWDKPYICDSVAKDYFKGFSVWRKTGSNQFPVDTCTTGLAGKGYTKLAFNLKSNNGSSYFYDDPNVEDGQTYCYRILAEFAQTGLSGLSFNRVESLPSEETCLQLNRDIPLITKVDVDQTDTGNGQIFVRWAKPLISQLDTTQQIGPYRFRLLSSIGVGTMDFTPISGADFTSPVFKSFIDTTYTHQFINTQDQGHTYKVEFFTQTNGNTPFTASILASSVYLNVQGTHEKNVLTWDFDTPWDNAKFEIYRENISGTFDLIGTTDEPFYEDLELENGTEYCYKIQTIGSYGFAQIEDPIFNYSQEGCGIPRDDVPPCPPEIKVNNICANADQSVPGEEIVNSVIWQFPPANCNNFQDIGSFNIYYASTDNGAFELIGQVNGQTGELVFQHQPEKGISGCYVVTSIDLIGNESEFSNSVCVDNCPFYELPNAFTPNGDSANDIFKPYPYRFIERIEINIFNRWGNLVFTSTNPDINWDGTNLVGKTLPDGVYHYICRVFEEEESSNSAEISVLKGFIELIAGSK